MEQIPLSAVIREGSGKSVTRKLRAVGQLPAIIYSAGHPAEMLTVAMLDLEKVLRQVTGDTAFLSLKIGDAAPRMAVLRELQSDYMGRKFLHADFYEVKADQEITLDVPLEFTGTAKGAGLGGVLTTAIHSVKLRGRMADLPDSITVDVSELGLGEGIHLAELTMPAGVQAVFEENDLVVHCVEPIEPEAEGEAGEEEPEAGE
ncbi:MAG: 50S ribosomal protein L25 [Pseudomonadota bacterium]